jgi:hypothetical protein
MIQDDTQAKPVIDYRVANGGTQFYWIAGLAIAATILYTFNSSIYFPLGLAATQLMADSTQGLSLAMRTGGALASLAFLGVFIMSGYYARKGDLWAFILGGSFYIVDAALIFILGGWYALAGHGFFLYYIIRGLVAMREQSEAPAI